MILSLTATELVSAKEFSVVCALHTASLSRLDVNIRVEVVVVNVLGSILAVGCAFGLTSIREIVPASLALVGEQDVGAIMPSQPSPHLLREVPYILAGLLVQPVGHGTVQAIAVRINHAGELTLESGESIIEGQCVRCQVDPA